MRRLCGFFASLWAVLLLSSPALADERILSFDSNVTINTDSSVTVVETIKVRAEGRQIRRGLLRDFPTKYKDKKNFTYRVGFKVLSVERNGQAEPYKVESITGGKRVRIGSADYYLSQGVHTYRIRYRTTHQLGHFEDYDEFYWNVTGDQWGFPIDAASITVHLPGPAVAKEMAGYTGPPRASGQDYEVVRSEAGLVKARSMRVLHPGEGFTFAVSWAEGYVARPSQAQKQARFMRDNAPVFVAWGGFLLIFVYYYRAWDRHGRDPEAGTIVPLFRPPVNFSPAACRYVWKMGYDRKAFTAALINMAVKGFIRIEDKDDTYRIVKVGTDADVLTKGERRLITKLVGTIPAIHLDQENYKAIGGAINAFSDALENEYQVKYFVTNRRYFFIGLALTIATLAGAFMLMRYASPESFAVGLGLGMWTGILGLIAYKAVRAWRDYKRGLGSAIWNLAVLVFMVVFLVPMSGIQAYAINQFGLNSSLLTAIAVFGLFAVNITFFILLKAPTQLGRLIMDEIEGFRLYLSTAEHHRLDALHPPERTPALFEKYLPYAMALDLETEWTEGFDDVLQSATMEDGRPYQPNWYSGSSWNPHRPVAFASSIGDSVSSAVATSASPPGSSSGSGGGGFSGGGGGGGGGGGW